LENVGVVVIFILLRIMMIIYNSQRILVDCGVSTQNDECNKIISSILNENKMNIPF